MKIAVVAPKVPKNVKELTKDRVIYAVDAAVSDLIRNEIKIDIAIGDFDSLKDKRILNDLKCIKLPKDKDISDTNYAIRHAYEHSDNVILVGGLEGKRVDHLIANLLLFEKYNNLVIYNEHNIIKRLEFGEYIIKKEGFKYLSIFPLLNTKITLTGTTYPLYDETLFEYDTLGLSNEIKYESASLTIHKGVILLIQSKEK
ncbi:MAG: thiamine diphosphokinase [Acholeplasmataceae bacterium]|nr:thiamine diphosphokinase [Acholeplasmataceae bacterium]